MNKSTDIYIVETNNADLRDHVVVVPKYVFELIQQLAHDKRDGAKRFALKDVPETD